ncbi:MAG: ABC transporter substrate-binding protein [Clostridia bacterium]|nr:ABC transporter substrate-binding protein [Clostridia bacterium]
MKLRKLISIALLAATTLTTAVGMTSCGSTAEYHVGIVQLVQHPALDAATQGFQDALKDKLGSKVSFDLQNAANDSATCGVMVNQFVSSGNVDLIMANATPALQAAATGTTEIPIVAVSITDYATALDIDNWTGKTGRNITGSSDLAPLADQAKMIKELVPDAKKVGILYCSAEPNSKYQSTVITEELKGMGLTVKEFTFADSNDLAAVTTAACKEVDVIYVPTDNSVASNTGIIDGIALPAGIPVVAGEEGICTGCGIATLSIDYYSHGYAAGEMAYEILVNGADPAEMDVRFATNLTKKYHEERCQKLGISVPEGYVAIETEE